MITGNESAWALHRLERDPRFEVVGLITSINETHERVAMHGVRTELLEAQARSVGIPLTTVPIPWGCSNNLYEARMGRALKRAAAGGVTTLAFGDLFLEDIRAYRERQASQVGLDSIFPIWGEETRALSRRMVAEGTRAILTCVDPKQCPVEFAGRSYDDALLDAFEALDPPIDPCGENGEFHTFTSDGPAFRTRVDVSVGDVVEREGFVFADVEIA
jgi:uncharacterized protein (TIGR00290 family)